MQATAGSQLRVFKIVDCLDSSCNVSQEVQLVIQGHIKNLSWGGGRHCRAIYCHWRVHGESFARRNRSSVLQVVGGHSNCNVSHACRHTCLNLGIRRRKWERAKSSFDMLWAERTGLLLCFVKEFVPHTPINQWVLEVYGFRIVLIRAFAKSEYRRRTCDNRQTRCVSYLPYPPVPLNILLFLRTYPAFIFGNILYEGSHPLQW